MKKIQNKIFLFFFIPLFSFSQDRDFQIWSSASVNNKITYKTDIYLKHGFRFAENASFLRKSFTELKVKYKYSKHMSFSLGFRDINEWELNSNWFQEDRYFADANIRARLDRFRLTIRNRFQKQGQKVNYNSLFRQKIAIGYNIRKTKLDPNLALEYFYVESRQITKARYTVSITYPIKKDLDIDFLYRIQKSIGSAPPKLLYILETKLSYNL